MSHAEKIYVTLFITFNQDISFKNSETLEGIKQSKK